MRARPFVATGLFRVDAAPAAANQYVFVGDGSDLFAYLYNDADYVSTRGSIPYGTFTGLEGGLGSAVIYSDSSSLVSDGSWLGLASDGTNYFAYVWDVDGGALYEWTVPNVTEIPTRPVYHDGKVYVACYDDTASEVVVYRGSTDLTGMAEWQREAYLTTGAAGFHAGASSTALFVEIGQAERHRFTFAGTHTGPHDITAETNYMATGGLPRSDGKMVFMNGSIRLCLMDSDAYDSSVTQMWPAWTTNLGDFSVNEAGTKAQCTGDAGTDQVRDATSGSFGGSPASTITLEDTPDGELYTASAFAIHYFGD